jgi:hypothetical protein
MPSCVPDRVIEDSVRCFLRVPCTACDFCTNGRCDTERRRPMRCVSRDAWEGAVGGVPRLAGENAQYMSHALSMFIPSDLPLRGSVDD